MQVARGKLAIDSVPTDCEVFVDGTRVGKTPLKGVLVPAGRRKITVRHPDYSEFERAIDIAANGAVDLGAVKLVAACTLDLSGVPSGVTVLLDGLKVSDGDRIRPGKHKLKLERAGYATQSLHFRVLLRGIESQHVIHMREVVW